MLRLPRHAGVPRRLIQSAHIDPLQARARRHGAGRHDLKHNLSAGFASRTLRHAKPQRIVMIEHRLQRRRQMRLPQTRRHPHQHRLVEALDRRGLLQAASA